jgi:hypothetical protein
MCNNKFGYLVPVNNYKFLAKKINYVLENYGEAKKKTKLAYKNLWKFNYIKQCKKYEKFINYFF